MNLPLPIPHSHITLSYHGLHNKINGKTDPELFVEESRVHDTAMLNPFLALQSRQSFSDQLFRVRPPLRLSVVAKFCGEHFLGLVWVAKEEPRLRSIPIYKSLT